MTVSPTTTEVLIAGAGPTGLTLALTLRQLGVDCVVVDPALGPVEESRAIGMHAGSLERLHTLGVAGELVDHGLVVDLTEIRSGGKLVASNDWTCLPSRFPMLLSVPQSITETVLEKSLTGGVRRGWSVDDFSPNEDSVQVHVTRENQRQSLKARFLVGCDGARSRVRSRLGVEFSGSRYPETIVLADCPVTGVSRDNFSAFYLHRDHGFLLIASLPGDLTRIGAVVADDFEPNEQAVSEMLRQRSNGQLESGPLEWTSLFKTHRRLVNRMRHGRVLLAGDAAHIHSPAGGQGMNLGIRDAYDLGHRLSAHLAGHLPIETLDEYDSQRRAEAKRVLRSTDRLTRFVNATGSKRHIANTIMRIGTKIGSLSDRIMFETSGINTPWPPGSTRPKRS